MTHIIIDGNVSKIKSILEGAPLLDDSVSYMCDGISYGDIQDIYNLLLRAKRYSELKDYNECKFLIDNIYISATGRVGFCCSNFKYYIGDLSKESLDDIWNSNHYRKMIQAFQSGRLPHFCRNCNLLEQRMLKRVEEIGE